MIPDYQTIMLPLLQHVADKAEHSFRTIIEELAEHFGLTESERKEMLNSGQAAIFDNRVAWAKTYLKKAGLIEFPKRGVITITEAGVKVLSKKPAVVDKKYLKQFPAFNEFIKTSYKEGESEDVNNHEQTNSTPEEIIDAAYQQIRESLAAELLQKVLSLPPSFFERLVIELMVKMGYGGSIKDAGKAIGKSGDEGIDGTIKEDKLGLDIIYLQAKRWQPNNIVGRPEIQKFVGALAGQGAKKGIFITTSDFTKEAKEYSPKNETKIVLINGEMLTQLMIDYNLGCATQQMYEVKRIDGDYFGEG